MFANIIPVIVTFILTGIVGNRLVNLWQHRNWLNQQKFLSIEKEYTALNELFDELTTLSGKRLYRMRRFLVATLHDDEKTLEDRRKEYDEALTAWNDKLNSFFIRLTFYARYDMALRLERIIQANFTLAGSRIEALARKRKENNSVLKHEIAPVEKQLNNIQGLLFEFNRDIMRYIKQKREETYTGVTVELTSETIELFPTWVLFKSLFKTRQEFPSIVCSAADLNLPRR